MCHKKFLHLLVLHFPPLVVATNPGDDDTGLLQTVVSADFCSVSGFDAVFSGASSAGIVASVGESLQNPAGAELQIVPC